MIKERVKNVHKLKIQNRLEELHLLHLFIKLYKMKILLVVQDHLIQKIEINIKIKQQSHIKFNLNCLKLMKENNKHNILKQHLILINLNQIKNYK